MGALVLQCDENGITEAAKRIKSGELIIYPTDTIYGLGCNALKEQSIKKVYQLKRRDKAKPLSIAVSSLEMLRRYTSFDVKALRVMECFFPGPVTFILRKKGLPDVLTSGSQFVGVRIPESRTALRLIIKSGVPIVSTSANISGREAPETAREALKQLPEVDAVLDAGMISGQPSTIIDLSTDKPRVLREGKKPSWEIVPVLHEVYGL